jgi:hypothetical protein
LRGTARLSARASSTVVDAVLGRAGQGTPVVTATTTLPGGLAHQPANVLDGDPATMWTTTFAPPPDQALRVDARRPTTVDSLELLVVDDPQHSLPAAVRVLADGREVAARPLTRTPAGDGRSTATIELPAPVTATTFEVVFTDVEARTTMDWHSKGPVRLPLAVAELGVGGLAVPPPAAAVDTGCRDDLVSVDDVSVPVRVTGSVAAALAGEALDVRSCGPVTIAAGDRTFRTAEGRATGIDLDQLVWRSAARGEPPTDPDAPVSGGPLPAPSVRVLSQDDATVRVHIEGAVPGTPFWLVLGQSQSSGWTFESEQATSEGTQLVDGYANGFLVTPDEATIDATLRFRPQNRVDVGLLVSAIAAVGALALALLPSRELRPLPIPLQEPLRRIRALTWEGALPTRRDARLLGLAAGIATALVVTWPIGLLVGVAAGIATRRETWRPLFTLLPAVLLAAAAGYVILLQARDDIPPGLDLVGDTGRVHPLGLTAVALLVVDVVISHLWARRSEYR